MKQLIAKSSNNGFLLEIDLINKDVEASWYGSESIDKMYANKISKVETLLKSNKLNIKSLRSIFKEEEIKYA